MYKFKIHSFWITLLFFILSCKVQNDSKSKDFLYQEELKLTFQENIEPISPIKSFEILNDSTVVVITERKQVILYDSNGSQIKSIKVIGEGELEILNPAYVKKFGNHFYVWCDQLLKILKFELNGIPVEEFKGFEHAIRDFEINDNYIIQYISNILGRPFIQVYSRSPLEKIGDFGIVENEQILLNFNSCAGGMGLNGNELLYVPSNNLRIHFLDLKKLKDDKIKIFKNNKFNVSKLSEDAHLMMNNDRQKALQYSFSNSLLTGIYFLEDFFILMAEVGQMEVSGLSLENNDREELIMIFDKNYNLIMENSKKIDFNRPCFLIKPYRNALYRVIVDEGADEMIYTLNEIKLGNLKNIGQAGI